MLRLSGSRSSCPSRCRWVCIHMCVWQRRAFCLRGHTDLIPAAAAANNVTPTGAQLSAAAAAARQPQQPQQHQPTASATVTVPNGRGPLPGPVWHPVWSTPCRAEQPSRLGRSCCCAHELVARRRVERCAAALSRVSLLVATWLCGCLWCMAGESWCCELATSALVQALVA